MGHLDAAGGVNSGANASNAFAWRDQWKVAELALDIAASMYSGAAFGQGAASGKVTRIQREVQTVKLIERVERGEITPAQHEQLTGFLDAERLGLVDRVYTTETARRRRKPTRELGVAASDGESEPLDPSLDDLLAVPRSAWAG